MEHSSADAPLIIAIDGPAGAGKSTVARGVAARLGLPYIDSGAMYRAIGLLAVRRGIDLDDADALARLAEDADLDFVGDGRHLCVEGEILGDALRTPEISRAASKVSTVRGVRDALRRQQQRLGRARGCVMEGRDIGTVVFPDAPVKVYLTASPEERVRRRAREMEAKGMSVVPEALRMEIEERDRRDAGRDLAPMRPAPDAVVLSTDGLTPEEAIDRIVGISREKARP